MTQNQQQDQDKTFLHSLFRLGIPIALQSLLMSSFGIIDMLMIGRLGEVFIAAVGINNQIFFVLTIALLTFSNGAAVFMIQYWGTNDNTSIKKILYLCLFINMSMSILFFISLFIFCPFILSLYTQDLKVIQLAETYFRIVSMSYFFLPFSMSFSIALKSTEQVRLPLYINGVALILNSLLNFLFIFGHFGIPQLGIRGVAIATLISKMVECGLFIIFTIKSFHLLPVKKTLIKSVLQRQLVVKYFKVTTPLLLHSMSWAAGIAIYNIFYCRISSDSFAAYNIARTIEDMTFVIFIGLSQAAAILLGKYIGRDMFEKSYSLAKKVMQIIVLIAVGIALLMPIIAKGVLHLYNITEQTRQIAGYIVLVMSCLLPLKVLNMAINQGILRSGGDTRYCFVTGLLAMWLCGIPGLLIGSLILKLPIYFLILVTAIEEVAKLISFGFRFLSKRWMKNLTRNEQ